jgi:hypothetical protein
MDERLRISLWVVCGGGLGAVLGGAFGGLTGALFAQSGRVAGTGFGRRVADAFARAGEREPSPLRQGIITGATDGVLFLGILGIVAGALLGASGRAANELLVPAVLGSSLLVCGAAFFGVLAYAMTRGGWTFGSVLAGGLLGSFVAAVLLGADRLILGVAPGLLAGLVLSFVTRRYAPAFHPPRIGEAAPRRRSDTSTDITRPDDSVRKSDPFEEEKPRG